MKACHSKYYLSLFQNRALAPLQIPASLCEGPIHLLYAESSSSYEKAPVREHRYHLHVLLLVYIEYDLTGSPLP